MITFDAKILIPTASEIMKRRCRAGTFQGRVHERKYLNYCTADHLPTGTRIIYTRDTGYHSSGWWKNPDYERCFHLSLSFCDPETGQAAPRDVRLTTEWIDAFYGDHKRLLWAEPPYSPDGKRSDTWHYRLFCDPSWTPMLPRGEVYSRDWTPAGWQSFSEVQAGLKMKEDRGDGR